MDRKTFESASEIIDEIGMLVDEGMQLPIVGQIQRALASLSRILGDSNSVNLNVSVQVFDPERMRSIPILQTGFSTSNGNDPHRTWEDATFQKYVVAGNISVVPHDYCPKCWSEWAFKFDNPTCPSCDANLGTDVKVLLDTDVCPHCEEGTISMTNPTCNHCGFRVDPNVVVWG